MILGRMFRWDIAHTGYVNAEGPSTNQTLWTFPILNDEWVFTSPAVVNGIAYFGAYDDTFYAVGQNESPSSTGTSLLLFT